MLAASTEAAGIMVTVYIISADLQGIQHRERAGQRASDSLDMLFNNDYWAQLSPVVIDCNCLPHMHASIATIALRIRTMRSR